MKTSLPWICCVGPAFILSTQAAVLTEPVEYIHGNAVLQGFMAHDPSVKGKRPGVLVVHQWKGLGDYEKKRGEMLAQLGYNVLAVDIYGKGVRADNPKDASELSPLPRLTEQSRKPPPTGRRIFDDQPSDELQLGRLHVPPAITERSCHALKDRGAKMERKYIVESSYRLPVQPTGAMGRHIGAAAALLRSPFQSSNCS